MTQKQQSLFTLLALIETRKEEAIPREFLSEKIKAALELMNPEVLLSESELKVYHSLVEKARKEGKII